MRFSALLLTVAAFAHSVTSPSRAEDEGYCRSTSSVEAFSPLVGVNLFKDLEKLFSGLHGYKDQDELDRYVECQKNSDACHHAYLSQYRKLIKAASTASGLPVAIITCLFLRESKFNKNAVNAGGLGISQFELPAWNAMKAIIREKRPGFTNQFLPSELMKGVGVTSRYYAAAKKAADFYSSHNVNGVITDRGDLKVMALYLDALEAPPGFPNTKAVNLYQTNIRTVIEHQQVKQIYADYLGSIGKTSLDLGNEKEDGRKNPEAAIILGAAYLRVHIYQGMFGTERSTMTQDRLIMATGGYNRGPAAMKCEPDMGLDDCIAATSSPVTRAHMKAIRNCSEKGNMSSMTAGEKGCSL